MGLFRILSPCQSGSVLEAARWCTAKLRCVQNGRYTTSHMYGKGSCQKLLLVFQSERSIKPSFFRGRYLLTFVQTCPCRQDSTCDSWPCHTAGVTPVSIAEAVQSGGGNFLTNWLTKVSFILPNQKICYKLLLLSHVLIISLI